MTESVDHLDDFLPHLNQAFLIHLPEGGAVSAELVEAEKLTGIYSLPDSPREPFSLLFELEEGVALPQRMYDVSLGERRWPGMFLVLTQSHGKGWCMQAVFN